MSKTADDVLLQHKTSETQPQGIDNTEVVSIEEKSKETFTEEKQFSSSKIFGKKNYKRQYDENELKCKDGNLNFFFVYIHFKTLSFTFEQI